MSDFVWLEEPVHKNNFSKIKWDECPEVLETFKISFDGAIMAVQRDRVEPFYLKNDVHSMRLGYKKFDKFPKVETADDLYEVIAYYIDL